MTVVSRLGYLTIGVSNIDEALEFYSRFVRLDITDRVGRTVFMTGGLQHHWLRIEEGNGEGIKRVSYEVDDETALLEVRSRLSAVHIEFEEGGDLEGDRVQHWLRFRDPGGFDIELYSGMYERGVAPVSNGVKMEKFLHAAWATPNFGETTAFYQDVLGFKVSDWIGDRAGFFRAADRYHHSLVLLRAERAAFNHFCIQVETLDDVMRARHNALKGGVRLRDDILRHAPSGSIGFYMNDEARNYAVEFCVGHPQLDDSTHQARVLPSVPESKDVWSAPLPEWGPPRRHEAPSQADRPVPSTAAWTPGVPLPALQHQRASA